jgi:hypothetical protein
MKIKVKNITKQNYIYNNVVRKPGDVFEIDSRLFTPVVLEVVEETTEDVSKDKSKKK